MSLEKELNFLMSKMCSQLSEELETLLELAQTGEDINAYVTHPIFFTYLGNTGRHGEKSRKPIGIRVPTSGVSGTLANINRCEPPDVIYWLLPNGSLAYRNLLERKNS